MYHNANSIYGSTGLGFFLLLFSVMYFLYCHINSTMPINKFLKTLKPRFLGHVLKDL